MDGEGPYDKDLSQNEQQCEAHFIPNVHKLHEVRFMFKFLFRENPHALNESKDIPYTRFPRL